MNKIIFHLLRAIARVSPNLVNEMHVSTDTRTAYALQCWIRDKGYCLPDSGIDEVAARIGVERDALCDYCNDVLHKRFLSWRKELRISEAQRRLRANPNMNQSRLAESIGLDRSNFRRQFREVTGMNPQDWIAGLNR